MTPWARIRGRWHRYKLQRAAKKYASGPLREFVYLDEVSVYSLIASRKGPIATDYRDTTSTLLQSELEGTAGANIGLAKSEVGSRVASSQTSEVQTVRKAVIQSTFGELYEAEQEKLAMRPMSLADAPDPPEDSESLRDLISSRVDGDHWMLPSSELTRGQMVELEVELQAHEVFQFGAAASSILDIVKSSQELMSGIDSQTIRQIVDGNSILQRLLVGLVPLKGRLVGYRSLMFEDREWLIHEHLLSRLDNVHVQSRPVFVVGVAERQLFWKDIRRVLFSRSQYVVLGRLARDGVHHEWSPVKLIDVLSTIPDVGESLTQAIQVLPTLMRGGPDGEEVVQSEAVTLSHALGQFGCELAERYGHEYPVAEVVGSGAIAEPPVSDDSTEARNAAFRSVRDHVSTKFDIEVNPEVAAELRRDVLERSGLWPWGTDSASAEVADPAKVGAQQERYIDAEFVAVYW